MDWQEEPWMYAFLLSAAINVSIALYFCFFAVMGFLISKCLDREHALAKAHRTKPNLMHCFYFDFVMCMFVVTDAIIVLFTSFPLKSPFIGDLPSTVVIMLTVVCGIRIFMFGKDMLLFKNTKTKIITLLVHFVFILVVSTVMITEMAGIMALIVIICEGDNVIANTGKLLRNLGYKHSPCYRFTMYLGCYAAIIFRALVPLFLLAMSLVYGQPFDMNHYSMVVFFVTLVFYGVINTWHVNSAVARVCKRKATVIEVPYATFVQEVDDSLKQSEEEIPPTYQDACHPDLSVISGSAAMATGGQEHDVENGACGNTRMEADDMQSDYRHVDMAAIMLSENGDSYQHSAISHA